MSVVVAIERRESQAPQSHGLSYEISKKRPHPLPYEPGSQHRDSRLIDVEDSPIRNGVPTLMAPCHLCGDSLDTGGGMVEPAMKSGVLLKCPDCGTGFVCGAQTHDCWCLEVSTKVVNETIGANCLCFDCLTRRADEASS